VAQDIIRRSLAMVALTIPLLRPNWKLLSLAALVNLRPVRDVSIRLCEDLMSPWTIDADDAEVRHKPACCGRAALRPRAVVSRRLQHEQYVGCPVLERAWMNPLSLYICPARRLPAAQTPPPYDQYGSYVSGGWAWAKTDYAANALACPARPVCLSLAQFTDGTAHTILIGEKAMDPQNYQTGTWFWDEPFYLGGAGGTERDQPLIVKDSRGVKFPHNWGSAHDGGAQFLFADGSVNLVPYATPSLTVLALMTPSGGEVAPDF
jgi:prepilin-type processing-associated H-X9-DG protein